MTAIPVLTLWQPWASLVALGVKHIETRSWSTSYPGPLAIHAGMSKVGATQCSECWDALYGEVTREYEPPLRTIVATCTLVDVVPIVGAGSMAPQPWCADTCESEGLGHLYVSRGDLRIVDDQRPYGDFTSGRYAWLLADVEPVDPPVKFKGGQGLTRRWEPSVPEAAL